MKAKRLCLHNLLPRCPQWRGLKLNDFNPAKFGSRFVCKSLWGLNRCWMWWTLLPLSPQETPGIFLSWLVVIKNRPMIIAKWPLGMNYDLHHGKLTASLSLGSRIEERNQCRWCEWKPASGNRVNKCEPAHLTVESQKAHCTAALRSVWMACCHKMLAACPGPNDGYRDSAART